MKDQIPIKRITILREFGMDVVVVVLDMPETRSADIIYRIPAPEGEAWARKYFPNTKIFVQEKENEPAR